MPDNQNPSPPSQTSPSPADIGGIVTPNNPSASPAGSQPTPFMSDISSPLDVSVGSVVTKNRSSSKKVVATILGLLILIGGVGAGIFLTQQQQDIRKKADTVTSEPITSQVFIPEAKCESLKAYRVTGNPGETSAVWTLLSTTDLTNLKADDVIYFVATVHQTIGSASVDAAKITINGNEADALVKPSTTMCPQSNGAACQIEFYRPFEIPEGTTTFSTSVKLHHQQGNTWF